MPRNFAEFHELCCGILQNLPRENGGPADGAAADGVYANDIDDDANDAAADADDDAADDDFRIVIDRSNFHNMHEKSTLQQVLSIGLQTALRPMYTTIMNSY